MAGKKKFDYFEAFEKQAEYACKEAHVLVKAVEEFTDASAVKDVLITAHKIESAADEVNHCILHSVAVDFVTPLDRDDIIELAHCLDDVIDKIEDVVRLFYMYDIHFMHCDAREMALLIEESAEALYRALSDFRNFKKSKKLRDLIMQVNECEERGDRLYLESMRRLYTEDQHDAVRIEVWSRIFDCMESCCDACEHTADALNNILLKI